MAQKDTIHFPMFLHKCRKGDEFEILNMNSVESLTFSTQFILEEKYQT